MAICDICDYRPMSAIITPNGVATHQRPGEIYGPNEKEQVSKLPYPARGNVEKNIMTGKYIDNLYQNFIESTEGKEFIKYLRKTGNGRPNTGTIDDIITINQGDNVVAATMPGQTKGNLILNADFIDKYASRMAGITGLSYDDVLTEVIKHELRHFYGQSSLTLQKPNEYVEVENDIGLIKFNLMMSKMFPLQNEFYLKKAGLHTKRYQGEVRNLMEQYIKRNSVSRPAA